jgi:hypothetical protein
MPLLPTSHRIICLLLLLAAFSVQAASIDDRQFALVDSYCMDCHNLEDFSGGLAFELMAPDAIHEDAENWEEVVRKLRGGMMPPPGEARPDSETLAAFITELESALDEAADNSPNPGAPLLHRLNRAEYANAVRDLLDLPMETQELFPAEDSSGGFDNIANVLSVSPALMQAWVTTAAKVSRLAVGDLTTSPMITNFSSGPVSQAGHLAGMPFGTRGGISIDHVFPLDAEYEISIRRGGGGIFFFPSVQNNEPIELTLDGERIEVIAPGSPTSITLAIPAGPHIIEAAFIHTQPEHEVDDLFHVKANTSGINGIAITGPLNVTGPGDTPSRRRIFTCYPQTLEEQDSCAEDILSRLASQAYRRPVDDNSLAILKDFYLAGKELRGFETGVQYAIARMLVDPQFIYRFEQEPGNQVVGDVYPVDDYELASRLSFFLWSSIPDQELLRLAGAGRLSNPEVLEAQVERMLADDKADALTENFASQWLALRSLDAMNPISPDFDNTLRESMKRETTMLFDSILREDRSIVDLLDADYTFVDERLARHYGIPNIRGSRFRRVSVASEARRGLLGHGSILTLTSAPNRTSPVIRGAWILENLLGTPPPPPPPGVETNLEETAAEGEAPTTMRQRLERHRADPNCSGCHGMIDPIGFALENFDAVGKWRDSIGEQPLNTETILWDGTPISGPEALRLAILDKRENFVITASEKLLTYALGRKVAYYDMPALREIVSEAEENNYKLSELIKGVVNSLPFQYRKKEGVVADL